MIAFDAAAEELEGLMQVEIDIAVPDPKEDRIVYALKGDEMLGWFTSNRGIVRIGGFVPPGEKVQLLQRNLSETEDKATVVSLKALGADSDTLALLPNAVGLSE